MTVESIWNRDDRQGEDVPGGDEPRCGGCGSCWSCNIGDDICQAWWNDVEELCSHEAHDEEGRPMQTMSEAMVNCQHERQWDYGWAGDRGQEPILVLWGVCARCRLEKSFLKWQDSEGHPHEPSVPSSLAWYWRFEGYHADLGETARTFLNRANHPQLYGKHTHLSGLPF